jgi:hypothetical protein
MVAPSTIEELHVIGSRGDARHSQRTRLAGTGCIYPDRLAAAVAGIGVDRQIASGGGKAEEFAFVALGTRDHVKSDIGGVAFLLTKRVHSYLFLVHSETDADLFHADSGSSRRLGDGHFDPLERRSIHFGSEWRADHLPAAAALDRDLRQHHRLQSILGAA